MPRTSHINRRLEFGFTIVARIAKAVRSGSVRLLMWVNVGRISDS